MGRRVSFSMPSPRPPREPNRRRRNPFTRRVFGSVKPDPHYKATPDHVEHLALMVDPTEYLIPSRRPKPMSMHQIMDEMVQKDHVRLVRVRRKSGPKRVIPILTSRGNALFTLNRFLLNKRPFFSLPKETRERLAHYHLFELILSCDYDSLTRKYDHRHMNRKHLFSLLRDESDLDRLNRSCLRRFGPPSGWVELVKRYYHYRVQKAALAEETKTLLKSRGQWDYWMEMRKRGELDDFLP